MHHILITDQLGTVAHERLSRAGDVSVDIRLDLDADGLLAIIPDYDALIVRGRTPVTAGVLAAATRLRVIGHAGVGVDNIDLAAATRRGIVVMNTPGVQSYARAELTLALLLAASRHLPQAHAWMRGGSLLQPSFTGVQLHDKVLGLIGFGGVGRLVAARAKAFGMEVLAFDPYVSEEDARELAVTLVELEDLFATADFISLHAPLSAETELMINEATLRQMKDGVVLVNAAHGKLVDEAALAVALEQGKVRAAGFDVYAGDPADSPLLGLPNVTHTPGLGTQTVEAEREVGVQIAEQVIAALRGAGFPNAVNLPYVLDGDYAEARPYMELAEKLGRLQAGLAGGPIRRIEVEVQGDAVTRLVRAIAAGLLTGVLSAEDETVNTVNAPALAHERGIATSRTIGINSLDYPNLIACRAEWEGGRRLVAGVLFGGGEPRIVQVDEYRLEARPEGVVLVMLNRDVPGVIGQVGTILAAYEVNIGEWRLGRDRPGGEALSFINLDSEPGEAVVRALSEIKAVTQVRIVTL